MGAAVVLIHTIHTLFRVFTAANLTVGLEEVRNIWRTARREGEEIKTEGQIAPLSPLPALPHPRQLAGAPWP